VQWSAFGQIISVSGHVNDVIFDIHWFMHTSQIEEIQVIFFESMIVSKDPTIASGATPIGNAGRAPDKMKKTRDLKLFCVGHNEGR
jgi:hypothetical protein